MNTPTFQIYRDSTNKFRWRLKAGNGEIVAASEAYVTLSGAVKSAARVKQIAPTAVIN